MPDPISWSIALPWLLAALLLGYLLGSIPFGLILTKLAGKGDVREIGSGNIGATNVLRTGSKALAAATLAGDLAKGALAVLLAARFGPDPALAAGFGAFLGHCFPVWLKFRGGKGVATFLGIALAFAVSLAAVFAVIWLVVATVTRYSSLASLLASLATTVAFFGFGYPQVGELFVVLTAIMWVKHRQNIFRLIKREESAINFGGAKPSVSEDGKLPD